MNDTPFPGPVMLSDVEAGQARDLRVGGSVRLTTTEFPGHVAALVLCQGCAWSCGYCRNPDLMPARGRRSMPWDVVRSYLKRRHELIEGVVFSGG